MADPMHRKIAEDLRKQIEAGELGPGQQLRTELELRDHYGASRNTVRDAIRLLVTLGLVQTRPGQGTFVLTKAEPFVTTLSADPTTRLGRGEGATHPPQVSERAREASCSKPSVEIQKVPSDVSIRLRVFEGTQVVSRHQRRIDKTAWSLQTSFDPIGFVAQSADRLIGADDIAGGAVKYLADILGPRQVGYRNWIKVPSSSADEAGFFKLSHDGQTRVPRIFLIPFEHADRLTHSCGSPSPFNSLAGTSSSFTGPRSQASSRSGLDRHFADIRQLRGQIPIEPASQS